MNKIDTKVGLEYAILPNRKLIYSFPFLDCSSYNIEDLLDTNKIYRTIKNDDLWDKVYMDDGAVEFVTNPLSYKKSLISYKNLDKFIKKHKNTFRWFNYDKGETHEATGGLHVNLDNIGTDELLYLILDTSNRPYLNWCFNDPSDDENANSALSYTMNDVEPYHYSFYIRYKKIDGASYIRKYKIIPSSLNKAISINLNYNHIEFRIFDIPQCYEELKLFIDIAIAMRTRAINYKGELPKADKDILNISKQKAFNLTLNFIENDLKLNIPYKVKKIWKKRLDMRYDFVKKHISSLK